MKGFLRSAGSHDTRVDRRGLCPKPLFSLSDSMTIDNNIHGLKGASTYTCMVLIQLNPKLLGRASIVYINGGRGIG